MISPKIRRISDAKLIWKLEDKENLFSNLVEWIENMHFLASVSIEVDIKNIKSFENPYLYQFRNLKPFIGINYSRFLIKDMHWTMLNPNDFWISLLKLSHAKAVDITMMNGGYQHISSNKLILKILSTLKIRRISLIKIKVSNIEEYKKFLSIIWHIPTLRDIEYSYDRNSDYEPEIRGTTERIKTKNFTNTKPSRPRRNYFRHRLW